ncbi:MAG: hypothetical protein FWG31_00500 [Oscillospiraceae bacterium]|nr:hypothetical protein [Oscillospiraceae bacterium]
MVTVVYHVDKQCYDHAETKHNISITTTEYACGDQAVAHIQMSENTGVSISGRINSILKSCITLQNEYYICRKTGFAAGSVISRELFEEHLIRFDKKKTAVVREIVETYAYTGQNGRQDEAQIIITMKGGRMTAVIDFRDEEQYGCFAAPSWLLEIGR